MAIEPTRFSRLSVGWKDSGRSVVDYDAGDTGPVISIDADFTLGLNGTRTTQVSSTTHDIDFGSVAAHDSSTVTVGISNATRGDSFILTPDSEWSGTDYDLALLAHSGDTTGEVTVAAVNSTITAHNPASTVFRITRIDFPDYI